MYCDDNDGGFPERRLFEHFFTLLPIKIDMVFPVAQPMGKTVLD